MSCGECSDHRIPTDDESGEEADHVGDTSAKRQRSGKLLTRSGFGAERKERTLSKSQSAFSGLVALNTYSSEEDADTSDSDAEFKVHPVLRGITKTKSEYAFPDGKKIRAKRADFELNLDKMLQSMERSVTRENEPPVAHFADKLDKIWPEPDEPVPRKKSTKSINDMQSSAHSAASHHSKMSQCWSSPPNVLLDDQSAVSTPESGSAYCWSAPELLIDDESDAGATIRSPKAMVEEEFEFPPFVEIYNYNGNPYRSHLDSDYCDYDRRRVMYGRKPEALFANSYPQIETPEPEPSITSIRLPSSGSSPAVSPSPPRPLSPVFGRPPKNSHRIPPSRSLQFQRLNRSYYSPDIESRRFEHESDSVDDDEEQAEREEEVWPESDVVYRDWRHGWLNDNPRVNIPRTQSYYHRLPSPDHLPQSKSAHSNLFQRAFGGSTDMDNSAQSQLNEVEQEDLEERRHWIERGSTVGLPGRDIQEVWQLREEYLHRDEPQPYLYGGREMRRSHTVDDNLRQNHHHHQVHYGQGGGSGTRRRLPRRPDHRCGPEADYTMEMPSSISMYGRLMSGDSDYSMQYDYSLNSEQRIGSAHNFGNLNNGYHNPPYESISPAPIQPTMYRTRQASEWIPTYTGSHNDLENEPPIAGPSGQGRPPDLALRSSLYNQTASGSAARSPLMPLRRDPYADIETPMSPPLNVLPSPALSTGRRLPPLPVRNSILDSLPTMSHITPGSHLPSAQPKEDHRLCFGMESIMGRSALEDSFYEEDGMNGNNTFVSRRARKYDSSGVSSCTGSESLNPTHRVQSAFFPRHSDEILLEVGDAVHVDRTCEDHWCYGTNLRTGQHGIFPSAVVCEIDLVEEICLGALPSNTQKLMNERDTFYLTLLASIEVAHHKGNDVLVQAINKVLNTYKNKEEVIVPQTVLMEVSFRGIHVIDKRKKNFFQCPTFDFFYSLQNISFCGAHPKQLKYFGFITKHPLLPRFACHVFLSNEPTQPIVESIGRAFKRSYDEYMAFAHPTEDIYLE